MLVKDLQIGDIFYGVDLLDPKVIEINQIIEIIILRDNTYDIIVESITGDGGHYNFPEYYDLSNPIVLDYTDDCTWLFSTDVSKLVEINEDILNDRIPHITNTEAWEPWDHIWKDFSFGE